MGVEFPEPAPTVLEKPTKSDADVIKELDVEKKAKDEKRDAEVASAAQKAISASTVDEVKKEMECKTCHTADEKWTVEMPPALYNVELDIATENQVNFAMDQYRAAHMF
jgi:cytochrome c2